MQNLLLLSFYNFFLTYYYLPTKHAANLVKKGTKYKCDLSVNELWYSLAFDPLDRANALSNIP